MKTRFAITHVNKDGMRTLSRANQSRNHFNTKKQADDFLKLWNNNNSEDTFRQLFGSQSLGTFEVRPVECHDSGDAKNCWFD